jgi:hypothetical protein
MRRSLRNRGFKGTTSLFLGAESRSTLDSVFGLLRVDEESKLLLGLCLLADTLCVEVSKLLLVFWPLILVFLPLILSCGP